MKICNSCMQMTGVASEKCPVCKMSEFTPLSADGTKRGKEIHSLKKSKGLAEKPHRHIRRVRYNLPSGRRSWFSNLLVFVVGSFLLSVVLNSTVWSSPGNPLDLGEYGVFEARTFGLTQPTNADFASMGTFRFKRSDFARSESTDGFPVVQLYVAYDNNGTTPANRPTGDFCLKTNLRHLESSLHSDITWAYETMVTPNPGPWDPEVDFMGFQVLNGYWQVREGEFPVEAYLGQCGQESFAWFRFTTPE